MSNYVDIVIVDCRVPCNFLWNNEANLYLEIFKEAMKYRENISFFNNSNTNERSFRRKLYIIQGLPFAVKIILKTPYNIKKYHSVLSRIRLKKDDVDLDSSQCSLIIYEITCVLIVLAVECLELAYKHIMNLKSQITNCNVVFFTFYGWNDNFVSPNIQLLTNKLCSEGIPIVFICCGSFERILEEEKSSCLNVLSTLDNVKVERIPFIEDERKCQSAIYSKVLGNLCNVIPTEEIRVLFEKSEIYVESLKAVFKPYISRSFNICHCHSMITNTAQACIVNGTFLSENEYYACKSLGTNHVYDCNTYESPIKENSHSDRNSLQVVGFLDYNKLNSALLHGNVHFVFPKRNLKSPNNILNIEKWKRLKVHMEQKKQVLILKNSSEEQYALICESNKVSDNFVLLLQPLASYDNIIPFSEPKCYNFLDSESHSREILAFQKELHDQENISDYYESLNAHSSLHSKISDFLQTVKSMFCKEQTSNSKRILPNKRLQKPAFRKGIKSRKTLFSKQNAI